ncbi:uncharacterized protein LOC113323968 [Papaver somniferum]|uniref:uncharacterized protein LOC113323968 n=1 Tax=Papaver somniferum TaxID=3469 RepID=UPI000E6FEF00|nr:uncharacterized protein LOC113323968 [Papaver somniferum]
MSNYVDKKWMKCPRKSIDYRQGVKSFIEFARINGGGCTLFSCPCRRCMNTKGLITLSEISFHLLKYGMQEMHTTWRFHGESLEVARDTTTEYVADNDVTTVLNESITADVDENVRSGMDENGEEGVDKNAEAGVDVNVGTSRCYQKKKAAEQAREPLYPSRPKGKLAMYATTMMNNIKTQFGISDKGVTSMLELMKELLPEGNTLPSKFPDIKKIIKELGMDYVTYDACINDCVLYWKDNSSLVKCPKTLRHFPIIARLKRLYSISWIAEAMLWNSRAQKDVNIMRHPVDSTATRPKSTSKDIDVYLQPLIDELKELWYDGVMTFDSFTKSEFLLKARLLWVIHDFTALGTLSGCVTHGYYVCPTCDEETVSEWLPYSKKICYMRHRRWLPSKHKYRDYKTNFGGGGKGKPPAKKRKRGSEGDSLQQGADEDVSDHSLFSRSSILHDLPNWGSNIVRHCTYVMHTKKNITEHIINTVMGNSKSKDGVNAQKDMEAMGIKKDYG